jgi:hypothetical protein
MTAIGVCLDRYSKVRRLPARVIDRYWRQLLDLALGEVEPDPGFHPGDRADRDGHFLTAPTDAPPARARASPGGHPVDDQAADQPDLPVHGVDMLTAANLHLTERHRVVGHRPPTRAVAPPCIPPLAFGPDPAEAVIRQAPYLVGFVTRVLTARREMRFLGRVELLELRFGTAQPDPIRRHLGEVYRDERSTWCPLLALRAYHQMGDRTADRADNHADHLAAVPIGTARAGPDCERRFCHRPDPLVPLDGSAVEASADRDDQSLRQRAGSNRPLSAWEAVRFSLSRGLTCGASCP